MDFDFDFGNMKLPIDEFKKMMREARMMHLKRDKVAFFKAATGYDHLDEWQEKFLLSEHRHKILNCSRQAGKTTVNAVDCLHTAIFEPKSMIVVIGPAERQSKEFFRTVVEAFNELGYFDFQAGLASDRKLGMELPNGSRIEALPGGSPQTIRGFKKVRKLVLDEAAHMHEDVYTAARPFLMASSGNLHMLSTPHGKQGFFYETWESAMANPKGRWEAYSVNAYQVSHFKIEDIEAEKAEIPARKFRQEFMCSFEDTDDQVFSYEDIRDAYLDDDYDEFGTWAV
jgi:hypothetical protein